MKRSVEENQMILSCLKDISGVPEYSTSYMYKNLYGEDELYSTINRLFGNSEELTVRIHKNGAPFYSNNSAYVYIPALTTNQEQKVGAVILDNEGVPCLYTYSKIQITDNTYTVYTGRDISAIYHYREEQIKLFIRASLPLTLACVLVLAIIIYFITRKVKHLQDEAQKVAAGDYSAQIEIRGDDEFSELGRQFNHMIDSVNANMRQIQQVSENRKLFIGDLTHEIKSPLTSIIGYSELLKNVKLTDEKKLHDYAGKIHEDGKYIEQLSNSLTQMVLMNGQNLDRGMTDLSELLKQTMAMAWDMLKGYHIPFETAIVPGVKKFANASLFQSLVINLLKNACKASSPGTVIKVTLSPDGLSVADQGKGIPLEELERIREPFYQVENKARTRQGKSGLGLGLPLCIKIAELHGWQLIIQSKVAIGTVVTIFFNKEYNHDEEI